MAVNLLKLCVGVESVGDLERLQASRRARLEAAGLEALNVHVTRNRPRRCDEVVDGGSLYWVIRRMIRVRQKIVRIDDVRDAEGRRRCGLVLGPDLVRVAPRPCRPFQGWRYLAAADAPSDLAAVDGDVDSMPEDMRRELEALGLL